MILKHWPSNLQIWVYIPVPPPPALISRGVTLNIYTAIILLRFNFCLKLTVLTKGSRQSNFFPINLSHNVWLSYLQH